MIRSITFSKSSLRNTIRVSNNLDLDQAGHFVGPDLGLQKVSADNTGMLRVKDGGILIACTQGSHRFEKYLNI